MGYHIDTWGEFKIEPAMTPGHVKLFNYFSKQLANYTGYWKADNNEIKWESEINKSYPSPTILNKLISTYLNHWGYTIRGKVFYQGENQNDYGEIIIKNKKAYGVHKI